MEFEAIDVDAIDVATDVTVELSVVDSRAVTSVVDANCSKGCRTPLRRRDAWCRPPRCT